MTLSFSLFSPEDVERDGFDPPSAHGIVISIPWFNSEMIRKALFLCANQTGTDQRQEIATLAKLPIYSKP